MGTSTFPYWLMVCFHKDSQSKTLKHKLESSYPSFKRSPMTSHPRVEENLLKQLVSPNTPHSSISLRTSSAFLSLYPQLHSLPPRLLSISSIPLPTPSHSFCPVHLENSIPLSVHLWCFLHHFNCEYKVSFPFIMETCLCVPASIWMELNNRFLDIWSKFSTIVL